MLKILELAAERLKQVKPKKIFFLCTDNTQFLAAAFPAGLFCLSAALHASNVNEFSVREYETAAQEPKILLLALQTRSKTPTSFQLDLISASSEEKKNNQKTSPVLSHWRGFGAHETSVKCGGGTTRRFHTDHDSGIYKTAPTLRFYIPFSNTLSLTEWFANSKRNTLERKKFLGIIQSNGKNTLGLLSCSKDKTQYQATTNFHLRSLC